VFPFFHHQKGPTRMNQLQKYTTSQNQIQTSKENTFLAIKVSGISFHLLDETQQKTIIQELSFFFHQIPNKITIYKIEKPLDLSLNTKFLTNLASTSSVIESQIQSLISFNKEIEINAQKTPNYYILISTKTKDYEKLLTNYQSDFKPILTRIGLKPNIILLPEILQLLASLYSPFSTHLPNEITEIYPKEITFKKDHFVVDKNTFCNIMTFNQYPQNVLMQ
jgi:hypothetical protein